MPKTSLGFEEPKKKKAAEKIQKEKPSSNKEPEKKVFVEAPAMPKTKAVPFEKSVSDSRQSSLLKRTETGITGLDELIEGGFPSDSIILISGPCGSGKTLFSMNFLVEGAKRGEPGLYISLEENKQLDPNELKLFGWNIEDLASQKLLLVTEPELYDFDRLINQIEERAKSINAKRIVIDSGSLIGSYFKDQFKIREAMSTLEKVMERIGAIGLFINEVPENSEQVSTYGVEEHIVGGVIVLYNKKNINMFHRAMVIRKMRSTNHSMKIHPFKIKAPGGVFVYNKVEEFERF